MAQFNDGIVLRVLNEMAAEIVSQAKSNASWSNHIPSAISHEPATIIPEGYEVDLTVDTSRNGPAPMAAAFEFGSGLHRTRGEKKKYRIPAEEKDWIGIPLEKWPGFKYPIKRGPKMFGLGRDGDKFVLKYVDHPGVAAKPYMRPAIDAKLDDIRDRLNQVVPELLGFGGKVEVVE